MTEQETGSATLLLKASDLLNEGQVKAGEPLFEIEVLQ